LSDDSSLFQWDTGKPDKVNWTIDSARFTYNTKLGEDLVLTLAGTYVDPDTDEKIEHEESYKCGSGWEAASGGAAARREDGRSKMFNGRTAVVQFIQHAVKAGVTEREIMDAGGPSSVDWVIGRTFLMEQVPFTGTINGEKAEWTKFLPMKVVGGKAATSSTDSSATITALAPSSDSAVSKALQAKLTKLAKSCDTHDEFIDKAFDVDGVSGDQAAEALVVDPAFYTSANA
jgi:hypothetical protein